ncbi:hypothetical protein [Hyalangium rubrum]|uniref:Lipoprotein n=1 Tax=Hyalangium rubrum TaxID=3103134 RepID=A0ABU5H3Y5_9BACT|nr:hypothetical protein [Hyalangium sp. s54d21]MDY7228169.1 hypothetical protein [Hyalangium sp. s54d21]
MKMESMFKKTLLAVSLPLLLTACGQTMEAPDELTQVEVQEEPLVEAMSTCEGPDEEVVEHACYHGDFGPFTAVTAAPLGGTTLPNVNLPHTAYNITLPTHSLYSYAGSVTYRPAESGEYAFLLSRQRGLKIYDGNTLVSKECSYAIDETACGSLRRMVTADLEEGKVYRLEFKAVLRRNSAFTLVIEEAGAHDHEE